MSIPLQPKSIRDIGIYGVIRPAEVDDHLIPEGAVPEAINFHFDRKGVATVRPGITAMMTTAGATIVANRIVMGAHNVFNSSLVVFPSDGSAYYWNGAGWGSRIAAGGLTESVKVRCIDFLDRGVVLNGSYDSIRTIKFIGGGGQIEIVTGDTIPLNMQQFTADTVVNPQTLRANLGEVFKSRIYLAGDPTTPDRLFFSSVATSTGKITWTPSLDWIDINPSDGEHITSLKRFSLELLVFKPNYIYRFKTSGTDPDPLIKIGTRSHESVIEGKKGVYFHHDTGFYRYSGGYPEEVSRAISDVIAAIPFSQYDDIIGWKDSDHIYWSLGNLTIPEVFGTSTWKNVVIRYTESSDIWTIYSYPSDIRKATTFTNAPAGTQTQVVFLDNGVGATFNSGTTDLGEPIKYRLNTKWYELEGIQNTKILKQFIALCEKAQVSMLMYQTDDNIEWNEIGQITKYRTFFERDIKFHRIRFKITGTSRNEASIFQGLELLNGINEGIQK